MRASGGGFVRRESEADLLVFNHSGELAVPGADEDGGAAHRGDAVQFAREDQGFASRPERDQMDVAHRQRRAEQIARLGREEADVGQLPGGNQGFERLALRAGADEGEDDFRSCSQCPCGAQLEIIVTCPGGIRWRDASSAMSRPSTTQPALWRHVKLRGPRSSPSAQRTIGRAASAMATSG